MSIIKTGFTLAIGVVIGIAVKSITDMEKDQQIIRLLKARYRRMIEDTLPEAMSNALKDPDKASGIWAQNVSDVVYKKAYVELCSSDYSPWIKMMMKQELDKLYNEYKTYKRQ